MMWGCRLHVAQAFKPVLSSSSPTLKVRQTPMTAASATPGDEKIPPWPEVASWGRISSCGPISNQISNRPAATWRTLRRGRLETVRKPAGRMNPAPHRSHFFSEEHRLESQYYKG